MYSLRNCHSLPTLPTWLLQSLIGTGGLEVGKAPKSHLETPQIHFMQQDLWSLLHHANFNRVADKSFLTRRKQVAVHYPAVAPRLALNFFWIQ